MLAISAPSTLVEAMLDHPDRRVALADSKRSITYGHLRRLIDDRLVELDLVERSVVLLAGSNSIDLAVTYLAVLCGGHVPILAGDDDHVVERLDRAWRPAAVVRVAGQRVGIARRREAACELHDDLALLLSTSGSTGDPRLVRLSQRNLLANAGSIADFLGIGGTDVGITSLPLHYSYGLSVLHSHLLVGASVVVTDTSVVDPCFRALVHGHGVTNLAGVPHSWDMLERTGADGIWAPSLRQLTQAGGRLAPDAVGRWAERAAAHGAEFVVMYGQTEATARMAYLPWRLTADAPGSIGVAIPGGELSLRAVEGHPPGVGELVYRGGNVMMGYAGGPADLALGSGPDELATGDLARFDARTGVYEIVGRRSRFVKPFGLRIDLDDFGRVLSERHGTEVAVSGDDSRIVVVATGACPDAVLASATGLTRLPADRIAVHDRAVPRTASGKIDHGAIASLDPVPTALAPPAPVAGPGDRPADRVAAVANAFAVVGGHGPVGADDTFVSLGGDSLGYVECSIRLEAALGHLPVDWHLRSVADLADTEPGHRRRLARVDTTVFLRAVGICMVVATHMHVWHVPGGAHTLLAVAGYNVARFLAPLDAWRDRVLAGLRTAGRAALPTMAWTAGAMLLTGSYGLGTLLLVNNYVGPSSHDGDHWHFWFIEVFVHVVLLTTVVLAVPAVRRLERRHQYLFPLGLLTATLVLRTGWDDGIEWYNLRFRTHGVAWFFVLGWLIQQSRTTWQRIATSALCLAVVPGYFHVASREWRIVVALVVLVWVREIPLPRFVVAPIGTLAAASMWIYVSHFALWPPLDEPLLHEWAYVFTVVGGVGVWYVATRSLGLLNTAWQASLPRAGAARATTPPDLQILGG